MKQIAAIIPTYKRVDKLLEFINNFDGTSTDATLYFVVTPEDKKSQRVLERLGQHYFVVEGEYRAAINYGFCLTTEPFCLFAADDVVFQPGWDTRLLELTADTSKWVFGGIDSWEVSQTMLHLSHPLVRRSHFTELPYYGDYQHYQEDVEMIQRAFKDNGIVIIPEILLEHPHPYNDNKPKEDYDETYLHSMVQAKRDNDIYNRRKGEFEIWDYPYLHHGLAIPTKLNPLYNKTLISVVIPSYNDLDYLKQCLKSVSATTYYRHEIIVINNGSDPVFHDKKKPWESIDVKEFLNSVVMEDESCEFRVLHLDKNEWINAAWNWGASMAKGNYVAFLNSDITLSKHWDKFLVAGLESPIKKATVACPFETNPGIPVPFGLGGFFQKNFPNMIKGMCFMLRESDTAKIFPIPDQIKHWCGDNWIADQAEKMDGVSFVKNAQIFHYGTVSGKRMDQSTYSRRIYQDILAYEKLSGSNVDSLKKLFSPKLRAEFEGHDSAK